MNTEYGLNCLEMLQHMYKNYPNGRVQRSDGRNYMWNRHGYIVDEHNHYLYPPMEFKKAKFMVLKNGGQA